MVVTTTEEQIAIMGFFPKRASPEKSEKALQRDLESSQATLAKLKARLEAAEALFSEKRTQARAAATGESGGGLDAASAALAAEQQAAVVREEIALVEAAIAQHVAGLKRQADLRARHEAASNLESEALALEKCVGPFSAAMQGLQVAAAAAATSVPFEIDGLHNYARHSISEIPGVMAAAAVLLRQRAHQVRDGMAPLPKKAPAPAAQPPAASSKTQQATVRVFTLRWPILWGDRDTERCARHQFVGMPEEFAKVALQNGYAIAADNPRARTLHHHGWRAAPAREDCVDLRSGHLRPASELPFLSSDDVIKTKARFVETRAGVVTDYAKLSRGEI